MNPFTLAQTEAETGRKHPASGRTALLVLLVALAASGGALWLKVRDTAATARSAARREVALPLAALDGQLSRLLAECRALAALARQGGGTIPNLQTSAPDLLASWPGLAWIDVEPGGVVGEVAPRAGHERMLGLNVLRDPVQFASAAEARRSSTPAACAPVALDRGEPGLILRVPVTVRGRDGRDYWGGFVAAALRFPEAVMGLRLKELDAAGYDYSLSVADSFQPGRTFVLARRGKALPAGALSQSVQFRNLTFGLTLYPETGWVGKSRLAAEACLALFVTGLLWLVFRLLETGREMESVLAGVQQRLARANAERKQGQEALAAAQDDLKRLRASVQQAESVAAELRGRSEAGVRASTEERDQLAVRLKDAEAESRGLQARLEGAARSLKGKQEELEESQSALQAAQAAARGFQGRLEDALELGRKATAAASEAQARAADWEARHSSLDTRLLHAEAAAQAQAAEYHAALARSEAAASSAQTAAADLAAARAQAGEHSVALVDLQTRLDAANSLAQTASADLAAAVARLDQLEARNRKLKTRLAELEQPAVPPPELGPASPRWESPALPPQVESTPPEPELPPPSVEVNASTPASIPPVAQTFEAAPAATVEAALPGSLDPLPAPTMSNPLDQPLPPPSPPASPEPAPEPPAGEDPRRKPSRGGRPKRERSGAQIDLFGGGGVDPSAEPMAAGISFGPGGEDLPAEPVAGESASEPPSVDPAERTPRPVRAPAPLNVAVLRKAANQILPLFVGQDPGARDCLKANREVFRAAFSPEAYAEFERSVDKGDFTTALELLKKAARRHELAL